MQPRAGERKEQGRSGAHDYGVVSLSDGLPFLNATFFRQAAVKFSDASSNPATKAGGHAERLVDVGRQHKSRALVGQCGLYDFRQEGNMRSFMAMISPNCSVVRYCWK